MARTVRLTLRMPAAEYALAKAYAADRRLPLAAVARAALMSEITRHAGRSHLLDQVWTLLEARLPEIVASAVSAQGKPSKHALEALSPRGEAVRLGG